MNMDRGDTRLLIEVCRKHDLLHNQIAYVLATAYHETAHTMKPVRETLAATDAQAIARLDRAFAAGQLKWVRSPYWRDGFFGRGYVQLTHFFNYMRAGRELGVPLWNEPERALEPELSAEITVRGMKEGWFTGKKLADYITASKTDYVGARYIVNGKDRAHDIAKLARQYEAALSEDTGPAPAAPKPSTEFIVTDWKAIQRRLMALGFNPGPIDGIRGRRTDAAIVAFKKSIGFRPRPLYGPLTHAALMGTEPIGQPQTGPDRGKPELPWMQAAAAVMGLHEHRNTSQLKNWFHKSIDPRSVPWCGAFVATCHRIADPSVYIPDQYLVARSWGKFGKECPPSFGATLTFWRGSRSGWKGHVGFYVGEDDSAYWVRGGNQSNAVTDTRIAKNRLLEARWPAGVPMTGKRVLLDSKGAPLSTNEA